MTDAPAVDVLDDLTSLVRTAWGVGRTIDLPGIGYGRIHWGNQTDVVSHPYPYYHFLAGLVRVTGARRILEIGTHSGGSIRAMKEGLSAPQGAVLVTVDTSNESDPYLSSEPLVKKIQGDALTEGTFGQVVEQFPDRRCDLLYVDATHDFWPTLQPLALYVFALRPRLVVMDDITLNPGMQALWALIRNSMPEGRTLNATEVEPAIRPAGAMRPGFGLFRPNESEDAPTSVDRDAAEAARAGADSGPVLVLGMPRSGTSAMSATLKAVGRYEGFPEGHFLAIHKDVSEAIRSYYQKHEHVRAFDQFLINRIAADDVVRSCARAIAELVDKAHGTLRWIDKTPGGWIVDAVPAIASALPQARFVFVRRRALETVRSARLKFSGVEFAELCRWWAGVNRRWLEVKPAVHGRTAEVEHRDMVEKPLEVAADVGQLLGFSPQQIERVAEELRTRFPEKTPGLDYGPAALDQMGWTAAEVATFREICGPLMDRLGYGYGISYYA
jgi:plasmid stability protein